MNTLRNLSVASGIVFAAGIGTMPVHAATLQFFGEDLGLGESIRLPSTPNADTARNNFFSNLIGVGTETFESFSNGTPAPITTTFGAFGDTATLTGAGNISEVTSGTNGVGRYPISGTKFYESTGVFSLAFSAPQAAFGFYGVDIGDFNGQLTLSLLNGGTKTITVPNSTLVPGGGALYFGIIETEAADLFTGITFGNTAPGTDFFAFDNFSIGRLFYNFQARF